MTKPISHGILCHKYIVKAMKRRVHSGALNREPRLLRRGKGIEPVDIVWLSEAVEDGLGAAHRGVILGCDGSNRYIAAL